jgi:putative Mg2+ transporter-C (MgtC) family protein
MLLQWFTHSWRLLLPPFWAEVALVLVAALCGGIVGAERERREKAAGLRTLVLVCVGATVFTMMSSVFSGDTGRVASQIVVGIGFLGAGVILREKGKVTGTTTAATIWVIASIGMVCGSGLGGAAIALGILVRVILGALRYIEMHFVSKHQSMVAALDFDRHHGLTRARIERTLSDYSVPDEALAWSSGPGEIQTLTMHLHIPQHHLRNLLGELVEIREVKALRRDSEASS